MLIPQNMPLRLLCRCSMGSPTIYQCSALLAKYRERYHRDFSVPAAALLF